MALWSPLRLKVEESALERRLRHLEARLAALGGPQAVPAGAGGGLVSGGRLAESDVLFDPGAGHDHDGENSKQVAGASILNPPWDGMLGAWAKNDISLLGTSDEEIYAAFSKAADDLMSVTLPKAGVLSALSVFLDGDLGGAGDSLTLSVYLNGSASALTLTLAGTAGSDVKGYAAGSVAFAAGSAITVFARKDSGTLASRKLSAFVWGRFTE
ncbi:MAG TPA: hypothetical protein VFU47_16205 [Armatimonadota bacterium]|nr:hypothetical protein [Armatimonadota bacterium]